jgi:non-specific protein-tyrosine kinase
MKAVDKKGNQPAGSENVETSDTRNAPAKEGLPLNKETVSTNGKSAREGWLSPKYRESKKVKLDYQTAARHRCVCLFPDLPYVEHYKMLRTQIQQRCGEKGWNTIMVTSVNPSEGKTVTAINLSVVLAKEYDQTVLLVDADLRNQQVHKYMGYQESHSLVDYLETDMSLSDVIVWPGVEKLTVISGESTVNDSTEILGSPRMSSLVEEMKTRYPKRYIIFDVPPVLDHADATSFAPLVDAILVVMEPGRTNLKDVLKMTELLPKEKIIGYAMNRYMQ